MNNQTSQSEVKGFDKNVVQRSPNRETLSFSSSTSDIITQLQKINQGMLEFKKRQKFSISDETELEYLRMKTNKVQMMISNLQLNFKEVK